MTGELKSTIMLNSSINKKAEIDDAPALHMVSRNREWSISKRGLAAAEMEVIWFE